MKSFLRSKSFIFSLIALAAAAAGLYQSGLIGGDHHEVKSTADLFEQTKARLGKEHGATDDHDREMHASLENHGDPMWTLPFRATQGVLEKAEELVHLDVENRTLRVENMNLRQWAQALAFDCQAVHAERKTRDLEMELSDRTGAA